MDAGSVQAPAKTLTFAHTGGAGDIVYTLPFIRHVGGGVLRVRGGEGATYAVAEALRPLLLITSYVKGVEEYSLPADYDFDVLWMNPSLHRRSHPLGYFDAFGVREPLDWNRPWLDVRPLPASRLGFALVTRTSRYRDPAFDWSWILRKIKARHKAVFFVGFESEHQQFVKESGEVEFLPTSDLLMLARYLKASEALYGNQSVCLTLAQALGTPYFLEPRPGLKRRVRLGLPGEHFLNYED